MNAESVVAVAAAAVAAMLLPPARTAVRLPRPRDPARPGGRAPEGLVRLRMPCTVCAGLGTALFVGGWVGAVLGAVAAVGTWRMVTRLEPPSSRRRRESLVAQLPMTVELLATCLTAGAAPDQAVAQVAAAVRSPMAEELGVVAARLRLGVDQHQVWTALTEHPQLGPLGRTLVRALDSGASVAEAMGRLAEDTRRAARADVESRARSVGVRAAVPLGLCLLPAFLLVGIVPLVAGAVEVFVRP